MSEILIDHDAFLIHGAAIGLGNSAYLFCAPSGTGKTTHCKLWKDRAPGFYFVNGDKPFIATDADGNQPMACGSPWAGKEKYYLIQ